MKNFKNLKRMAALFASAAMLVSFVGCNSDDTAKKIAERTSALETYTGTVDLKAVLNYQNADTKIGMHSDITVQEEPFFAKVNLITSSDDANNSGEYASNMYLTTIDGVNTAYAGYEGEWYKQIVDTDNFPYAVSQYNPLDNGVLFMQASTKLTNVGTELYNGCTANRYEGSIAKGLLPDLMEATGAIALIGQQIDASYFVNAADQPITIWVNDEDGIVIGYSLDLTNMVNNILTTLYEGNNVTDETLKIKAVSYVCEGNVKDYNIEIDTTVPSEALNAPFAAEETENNTANN